jgi:uncharacterized protein (TIGR02145 family)
MRTRAIAIAFGALGVLIVLGLVMHFIGREGSNKAKMGEVPRVLAYFETALLAALVENGDRISRSDLIFETPDSKWFAYEISADAKSCKAIAKVDIGGFKKGGYIATTYNSCAEEFVRSSDNETAARELIPDFSIVNGNGASGNASDNGKSCFTDSRDGKKYKAVTIGGKTWMAENLNYQPQSGKSWCYKNDGSYCDKYGRLYDWNTARRVCPAGWHLPSRGDWDNLSLAAGGKMEDSHYWGAGEKLKAKSGWNQGESGNGTDDFGFSALPGGHRNSGGRFLGAGNDGDWWTATGYNAISAYRRGMSYDFDVVVSDYNLNSDAFSVRCVRD